MVFSIESTGMKSYLYFLYAFCREFLEMMRDTLTNEKARLRGIFNEAYINDLLKNPEAASSFTNIQGSKLWHAALLELWFESVGL